MVCNLSSLCYVSIYNGNYFVYQMGTMQSIIYVMRDLKIRMAYMVCRYTIHRMSIIWCIIIIAKPECYNVNQKIDYTRIRLFCLGFTFHA